jgi:hypothetical protein
MSKRLGLVVAALLTVAVAVVGADGAWAFFTASASKTATATGDTFPTAAGVAPTVSITSDTATITFAPVATTGNNAAATSYTIRRYSASDVLADTLTCTPSGAPVNCSESSGPAGPGE